MKPIAALAVIALCLAVQSTAQAQTKIDPKTELHYQGTVVPAREAEITPLVSGWLNKIHFKPGQYVQKGDVLFEFNKIPTELQVRQQQARLARAEAELQLAEAGFGRARELNSRNVNSEVDVQEATARRDIAAATVEELTIAVDLMNIQLGHLTQRAPISGIMSAPMVMENGWQEKTARDVIRLATITQLDPIRVVGEVPYEVYAARRKIFKTDSATIEGLVLTLEIPNGELFTHEGRYISGGFGFDAESQKITAWAEFPNPDQLLRPGLKVTIRSKMAEEN